MGPNRRRDSFVSTGADDSLAGHRRRLVGSPWGRLLGRSAPCQSLEERAIVPHCQAHGLRVDVLVRLAVELFAEQLVPFGEPPKQFADDGVGLLRRALRVVQEAELDGLPARPVALQLAGTKDLEVTVCRARPRRRGGDRSRIPVLQHRQLLARRRHLPRALAHWQRGCGGARLLCLLVWGGVLLVLDRLWVVWLFVRFLRPIRAHLSPRSRPARAGS